MILRFFPNFPLGWRSQWFPLNWRSFMIPQMIYGRGYLFVSDFYIYIYINIYRVPFFFFPILIRLAS